MEIQVNKVEALPLEEIRKQARKSIDREKMAPMIVLSPSNEASQTKDIFSFPDPDKTTEGSSSPDPDKSSPPSGGLKIPIMKGSSEHFNYFAKRASTGGNFIRECQTKLLQNNKSRSNDVEIDKTFEYKEKYVKNIERRVENLEINSLKLGEEIKELRKQNAQKDTIIQELQERLMKYEPEEKKVVENGSNNNSFSSSENSEN